MACHSDVLMKHRDLIALAVSYAKKRFIISVLLRIDMVKKFVEFSTDYNDRSAYGRGGQYGK